MALGYEKVAEQAIDQLKQKYLLVVFLVRRTYGLKFSNYLIIEFFGGVRITNQLRIYEYTNVADRRDVALQRLYRQKSIFVDS